MTFEQVVVIGFIVEALVETLKPIWDVRKRENLTDRLATIGLGILVAILGNISLFVLVGVPLDSVPILSPWVGNVLTGIAFGRGGNVLHELIKLLQSFRTNQQSLLQ